MTNGELFIAENPNIEFKLNGSCVWIYFDGVNHYTMPVEWWDKEISLFNKIRAEIIEKYWDCEICKWKIDYKPHYNIRGDINDILQIIDKYRNEGSK